MCSKCDAVSLTLPLYGLSLVERQRQHVCLFKRRFGVKLVLWAKQTCLNCLFWAVISIASKEEYPYFSPMGKDAQRWGRNSDENVERKKYFGVKCWVKPPSPNSIWLCCRVWGSPGDRHSWGCVAQHPHCCGHAIFSRQQLPFLLPQQYHSSFLGRTDGFLMNQLSFGTGSS